MSWTTNNIYSRWEHLWTDEGIARCIEIIKEKDRIYIEGIQAAAKALTTKSAVKEILEPIWETQKKKKVKPALKQILPDRTPKCCVGCKKFRIHPNPPPHFTVEDMAHCCAYCRITNGKRHGEHCPRVKV